MNYKDTLNLPRTDFPMKANLVQREPEFLARWEKDQIYSQIRKARQGSPKFVLHDGPPFANGDVHMGTALNKILKDIIVKYRTMTGHWAPYVPGWDCHGLPIEYKVVKNHANLSSVEVRRKCEEFARKYIDIQKRQFKRLGVFGDWDNPYLTLDRVYEAEILRVFAGIVERGLVYRGQKPVYWSTGCQTALAEAEVEYADKTSPSIFVKFKVAGSAQNEAVMIWTTTPWTLPANLAVAIHPRLQYARYRLGSETVILCSELSQATYEKLGLQAIPNSQMTSADLLKLKLKHPFLEREVPLLAGDFVAADTGTGCVHIAPGHGQDDYQLAKHLGLLSPVDDNGRFTAECGISEWVGKLVFDANPDVIALLKTRGALVLREDIQHSYPHCWRSKTPVIFRAVEQWFIRVEDLKPEAKRAIESVSWVPSWGENRIRGTVEARSDWCISRQRSWGVPLPIFYRSDGSAIVTKEVALKVADLVEKNGSNVWFEWNADQLATAVGLPEGLSKRNDTLDVWIDSGSSHRAVLNRHADLHFPADVYLEGSDQHRGWFQSSLLTSVAVNQGKAPYKTVVTNGFLVDLDGKKISKSSTYEKPKDAEAFVNKYGADVVRLWVASENYQNDVPLSEEIFTRIGETYRSVRNTFRILLANLADFDPVKDRQVLTTPSNCKLDDLTVDRWMLGRLQNLIEEVRKGYESYEFFKVYHAVNTFCTVDVSALYVDVTKDRMYCDSVDSSRRRATQTVLHEIVSTLCKLMAPILSFTSEEAWGFLTRDGSSIFLQELPVANSEWRSAHLDEVFKRILHWRSLASSELEKARQTKTIGKSVDARLVLHIANQSDYQLYAGSEKMLAELMIVSQVDLVKDEQEKVEVATPRGKKCVRSWRWDETVGQDPAHPELSARDAEAVRKRG